MQRARDNAPNTGAQRAMLRVKQRLRGTGEPDRCTSCVRHCRAGSCLVRCPAEHKDMLSVEGQVKSLLNDAQDPDSLALMYYGWCAWV